MSIAGVRAAVAAIERRAARLRDDAGATVEDLSNALTDASAWRLALEAECVRLERQATALESRTRSQAQDEAADLFHRREAITAELERLLDIMQQLRMRLDQVEAERPG